MREIGKQWGEADPPRPQLTDEANAIECDAER